MSLPNPASAVRPPVLWTPLLRLGALLRAQRPQEKRRVRRICCRPRRMDISDGASCHPLDDRRLRSSKSDEFRSHLCSGLRGVTNLPLRLSRAWYRIRADRAPNLKPPSQTPQDRARNSAVVRFRDRCARSRDRRTRLSALPEFGGGTLQQADPRYRSTNVHLQFYWGIAARCLRQWSIHLSRDEISNCDSSMSARTHSIVGRRLEDIPREDSDYRWRKPNHGG